MKMGVKICFGTDVGAFEHGTSAREFVKMVEYGMKPIDAIRAATTRAAELLRMEKQIGSIASGRLADIIAVEGDPLIDIKAPDSRDVRYEGREGVQVADVAFVRRGGSVPYRRAPTPSRCFREQRRAGEQHSLL